MAVGFSNTNKPINPRGNDASPKAFNRAKLFSGKALDFDGVNDYVEVADNASLDFTTAMSAFCYVRVDSVSQTNNTIFSKFDFGTDQRSWLITQWENNFRVIISKNGLTSGTNIKDYDFFTFENTNDYYFIGFTFESNVLKLYVNGQEVEPNKTIDSEVNAIHSGTAKASLGCNFNSGGATSLLDGKVANARLFNTALTAAQVADLYNNPEKVVPTGVDNTALKLFLPMQEGAGTTAYDGSGNGNHGTISGATYTHGIGAPVSQTAVMNWNKAKNDIGRSQEFDNAYWSTGNITITANDTTAPDGTTTADKLVATSTSSSNAEIFRAIGFGANDSASVFVKSDTAQWVTLGTNRTYGRVVWFDIINGIVGTESTGYTGVITEYPNGWYKLDASWDGTATTQTYWDLSIGNADNSVGVTAGKSVFAWGAYANLSGTTIGPYIATLTDSAITSPVLLPQGLTTGRDITGVNLFENVRKQGALNLAGNSWAEVHDNASVDFGTGSFSIECWSKAKYENTGSAYNVLLTLGGNISTQNTGSLYIDSSLNYTFRYDSNLIVASGSSEGDWSHVVGVYDGTNINIYLNGSFVVQTAASATSKTNTFAKVIGSDDTAASRAYKDQIAQPRIYNRALTAAEVLQNYNSGKNTYK